MPLLIKGAERKRYVEKKYYEKHDRRKKPEM